jgi:hypothetical protein
MRNNNGLAHAQALNVTVWPIKRLRNQCDKVSITANDINHQQIQSKSSMNQQQE